MVREKPTLSVMRVDAGDVPKFVAKKILTHTAAKEWIKAHGAHGCEYLVVKVLSRHRVEHKPLLVDL